MASRKITKYTPGFNLRDVQKKYKLNKVIKLSSNENPYISDKVSKYISKAKHNINLSCNRSGRVVNNGSYCAWADEDIT